MKPQQINPPFTCPLLDVSYQPVPQASILLSSSMSTLGLQIQGYIPGEKRSPLSPRVTLPTEAGHWLPLNWKDYNGLPRLKDFAWMPTTPLAPEGGHCVPLLQQNKTDILWPRSNKQLLIFQKRWQLLLRREIVIRGGGSPTCIQSEVAQRRAIPRDLARVLSQPHGTGRVGTGEKGEYTIHMETYLVSLVFRVLPFARERQEFHRIH